MPKVKILAGLYLVYETNAIYFRLINVVLSDIDIKNTGSTSLWRMHVPLWLDSIHFN